MQADVFKHLRQLRDQGAQLRPDRPRPAEVRADRGAGEERGARLQGHQPAARFKLLAPGGLLATFSCSGGVSAELFQSIVAGAALDAGADAKIIERFGAAADHPVALEFPEGEYLKGLLLLKSSVMRFLRFGLLLLSCAAFGHPAAPAAGKMREQMEKLLAALPEKAARRR